MLRSSLCVSSRFPECKHVIRLDCVSRRARLTRLDNWTTGPRRISQAYRPYTILSRAPQHNVYNSQPPHLICLRTRQLLTHPLHTSSPRTAPQFLLLLFGPVSRFMVAIGGRLTRSWWSRLTPDRRAAIKSSIRKNRKYFYGGFGILTLFGLGYYTSHLEKTPLTQRTRLIVFPRDEVVKMIKNEKQSVLNAICDNDEHMLLHHEHPLYMQVHKVVSRIIAGNNIPEFEGFDWTLYVVDKPNSVNALCLPTGDIFVFTGLVNQCRNDEELAFILSHEIAHAVLGHGVEALSHNGVLNFIQLFLIAVIWAVIPSDLLSYFMHSFSRSTVKVVLEYPHSRKLESEADMVSFQVERGI